jgi:hypothetical protein
VPSGIDDARGLNAGEVTPQDPNLLSFNPHGSIKSGVAGAVDDHPVPNQQI